MGELYQKYLNIKKELALQVTKEIKTEDEALKAREDHALRIARIQAAQSAEKLPSENAGARGIKDLDTNPGSSAKNEKTLTQDPAKIDTGSKPVRGEE
jgi:hypothetical protein